jgi:hypothetical protein
MPQLAWHISRRGIFPMGARLQAAALIVILLAGSAQAQGQAANRLTRVSATVVKFDGHVLTLQAASGKDMSVVLPADARVLRSRPGTIADVKPGEFIGCTAVEGSDGKLSAKEVHILPEPLRGVGEGHYPWGSEARTSMTNGNIEQVAGITDGHVIKVSYKGGESDIDLRPNVPVAIVEITGRDMLKPGTRITLFEQRNADGSETPQFVSIAS